MGRSRAVREFDDGLGLTVLLRGARLALTVLAGFCVSALLLVGHTDAAPAALPTVSVEDVNTVEGGPEGVDHTVSVPVTLSQASSVPASVEWRTVDGTAIGGNTPGDAGPDYYLSAGTVVFTPGETTKTVQVLIDGGISPEPDETFTVELSNPVNATIARAVGTVTILNDDVPPPPDPGEVNVIPAGGGGQCISLKSEPGCRALLYGEQLDVDDIRYISPGASKVTVRSIVGIGTFYGGQFSVQELDGGASRSTAGAAAKPILVVKLRGGSFQQCKTSRRLAATSGQSVAKARRKPIRRLWGKGKGRFRTRGQYSSGTVRGTNWVTEDFCDGTRTRVVAGVVQVYDLVQKKWVVLEAGQSYWASKAGAGR